MCTHVAALTVAEPEGEADAESEGECDAAEVAAGFGALLALLALLDELQPAITAAPLQVSATIARRARPTGRLGQPDLVFVS
jgi:hypothetical protein